MTEWIITASVLILTVLILRYALRGRISLRLQYALWALVLLRLLVPVALAESSVSVMNAFPAGVRSATAQNQPIEQTPSAPAAPPAAAGDVSGAGTATYNTNAVAGAYHRAVDWGRIAVSVWLSGAAAVGLTLLASNIRFALRLRRTRRATGLAGCPLPVYETGAIATPCMFGLFRPAIYVTPEVLRDETALRHVLEHETTHRRHGDHLWSFLRCVCLALHWYNPLVWLAALLSRHDAELACDEATIRCIGEDRRAEYGRVLIGLTYTKRRAGALLSTATTMTGSRKSIRERVTLIAKKPKTLVPVLIAVLLITAAAVGCTFTGAGNKPASFADWTASITKDEIEIASVSGRDGENDVSAVLTDDMLDKLVGILNGITEDACAVSDDNDNKPVVYYDNDHLIIRRDGKNWVFQNFSDGSVRVLFNDAETGAVYGSEGKLLIIDCPALYEFISSTIDEYGMPAGNTDTEIIPLTADEVAQYNKTFEQPLYAGYNPLTLFLTSYYDRPEDINLVKFLWYIPPETEVTDGPEFEAIKAHKSWIGPPDAELGELPFPIHRVPAAAVNEVLQKYADITLGDLSGVGTEKLTYLEEYDAYYTYTSDWGPGSFICTRGEKQGDIVRLYGDMAVLTLKIQGDSFLIVSCQQTEKAKQAAAESAPPAPETTSAVPAADIRDYMPDLIAGKDVNAWDLLPCLESFTESTWEELDKAYGPDWWNPLWSALDKAALSDSLADTEGQTLRDYYIGKAYLASDGAYAEGLSDLVMRQWDTDPLTYSACLVERFSGKEADTLRRSITYSVSLDSKGRGSPFGLYIPGSERGIYLGCYPVGFPFACDLTETSRKSFKAESFGPGNVVESDDLQVTYFHDTEDVYTVSIIRAVKQSYAAQGVAIGDTEEQLLARWPEKLEKLDSISYDDEAWFGTDYDHAYAYTPEDSTKSLLYLIKDGLVSGIEIINGLDGPMY
jgi:beta-lactamase regulating signal transducer with metallopeptidase domain